MRKTLTEGTIIELFCEGAKHSYQIDRLIGEGASCVAYDAHRINTENAFPRCRIKECYPAGKGVERVDGELQWASEAIRDAAYERFRNAHNLMVELRDDETLGNNITSAELCKGNGTLYSVMEVNHGGKFSDELDADLWTVIDTLRVLADVVDRLHAKGYLHLDIKPDNFWVCHQPSTMLWLFDVDSMLSLADLRQKKVTAIPYSKGYAAPEQEQWRLNRLGPASDVYAIGAVLFEKIMKRLPTCWDRGMFAEWDFDGEFFDKVNPQIKRHLNEVFLKTLAAYPGSRYQAASELSATLRATEAMMKEPYLVSNYPVSMGNFVGREEEIERIEQAFSAGEHLVFLYGVGGIGKSELAKQYAKQHAKNYDAVLFLRHEKSIAELLDDVDIRNFEGDNQEKRVILKQLLDQRILLIIDGYDDENEDECGILECLNCHVIITSRTNRAVDGLGLSIPLSALHPEKQLELFENEYGNHLAGYEAESVERILAYSEGHTLLISLLAKQMKNGWFDFKQAEELFTTAGFHGISKGKIRHRKDGIQMYDRLNEILKKVFKTVQLTELQREILRSILLLRPHPIDQSSLVKWMGNDVADVIDELYLQGWITRDKIDGAIFLDMHTVIGEVIREEQKPTILNCSPIKKHIETVAGACGAYNRTLVEKGFYADTHLGYRSVTELGCYSIAYCTYLVRIILDEGIIDEQEKLFWASTIEKIVSPKLSVIEPLREILLSMWNDPQSNHINPSLLDAKLAFSLAILDLDKLDFRRMPEYIQCIANVEGDALETYMLQFHACFSFYDHLSLKIYAVDLKEYPRYEETAQCVKNLWEKVLVSYPYETAEGLVISTCCGEMPVTKVYMQQAYDRFCKELFGTHVYVQVCDEQVYNGEVVGEPVYVKFYSDARYNEAANELKQIDTIDDVDKARKYVQSSITALASSIPYEMHESEDSLIIRTTFKLSRDQKRVLAGRLLVIDKDVAIHWDAMYKLDQWEIAEKLGAREAMLVYAYAILEDWRSFESHLERLLDRYKENMLFYADEMMRDGDCILPVQASFPGLLLLLNEYGSVLPDRQAMGIFNRVVKMAECIFTGSFRGDEVLFRLYTMGWKQARRTNDSINMTDYLKKMRAIAGIGDVLLRFQDESN